MRIFLIGFMGSGKTYWGRRWAAQHQLHFFDLDDEIEHKSGSSVATLFENQGEAAFRKLEQDTLLGFGQSDSFILSCGGGTPCYQHNIKWMNEQGTTVYLDTPVRVLIERLDKESQLRPLLKGLTGPALEAHIASLLEERQPHYRQASVILPFEFITDINFEKILANNA